MRERSGFPTVLPSDGAAEERCSRRPGGDSSAEWPWCSALLSAAAAAVGYGLLGGASPTVIAVVQAFAGGAILTMLADTMMPEGFEHAGNTVGLMTSAGFVVAFLLGRVRA